MKRGVETRGKVKVGAVACCIVWKGLLVVEPVAIVLSVVLDSGVLPLAGWNGFSVTVSHAI